MRWLLLTAGIGCFITGMELGGGLSAFWDIPSFFIVLAPTFLLASAYHSPSAVLMAPSRAWNSGHLGADEIHTSAAALKTMRTLSRGCACLGLIIGIVLMLADLSDPAKIGPAMAVALLCPLYGVFFSEMVAAPLLIRLQEKHEALRADAT